MKGDKQTNKHTTIFAMALAIPVATRLGCCWALCIQATRLMRAPFVETREGSFRIKLAKLWRSCARYTTMVETTIICNLFPPNYR